MELNTASLVSNVNRKHDFRKALTREVALSLAVDQLRISESLDNVPFDPTPVSVGRIEVGWLFEFRPTKQFDTSGHKVYHVRYVVDDKSHRVHGVGTAGVDRVIDRIHWDRQR